MYVPSLFLLWDFTNPSAEVLSVTIIGLSDVFVVCYTLFFQLGQHVGANKTLCCDNFIDIWKTVSNGKDVLSVHDFVDIESLQSS